MRNALSRLAALRFDEIKAYNRYVQENIGAVGGWMQTAVSLEGRVVALPSARLHHIPPA
jgi:hypothetical protein